MAFRTEHLNWSRWIWYISYESILIDGTSAGLFFFSNPCVSFQDNSLDIAILVNTLSYHIISCALVPFYNAPLPILSTTIASFQSV